MSGPAPVHRAASLMTDTQSAIVDLHRGSSRVATVTSIAIITASTSPRSTTAALAARVAARLGREGFRVITVHVGDLPAADVLFARRVLAGLFLLHEAPRLGEDGQIEIDDELGNELEHTVRPFIDSVVREGLALPAREVAAA
ncbi:hypothetical protein [Sorangium sp. So ce854]|uniref:hypothetical protein n=1 Tax=Sorangium sp. So ce854 TaxID=3133322 RepID=UPI003F639520